VQDKKKEECVVMFPGALQTLEGLDVKVEGISKHFC
jgi:hypothetical protein